MSGSAVGARHITTPHYAIPFGQVALFLAGVEFVALGIVAIMPIPPLDGGKLLVPAGAAQGLLAEGAIPP